VIRACGPAWIVTTRDCGPVRRAVAPPAATVRVQPWSPTVTRSLVEPGTLCQSSRCSAAATTKGWSGLPTGLVLGLGSVVADPGAMVCGGLATLAVGNPSLRPRW